ncbi:MAG TPA: hypothetical protein VGD88_04840 [Opitutaceae bacterium]
MTPVDTSTSVFRRMLALRTIPPFDRLSETELTLIAEVAEPRQIAPNDIAHNGDSSLNCLWVTVAGELLDEDGRPAGRVNGLSALLTNALTPELRAGPAGAQILVITKGYFFTLTRECPAFVLGLLTAGHARPPRP